MSTELPRLFLTRHGDTAWTDSGSATGRTDLPLNKRGEERARQIGPSYRSIPLHLFSPVLYSELPRRAHSQALRTWQKSIPTSWNGTTAASRGS